MSDIHIDAHEVAEFATELRTIGAKTARVVPAIVAKGAQNIKNEMRDDALRSRWFKFARTIDYDILDGGMSAEIGPNKAIAPVASLANLGYFGGANGGGGTIREPSGALENEVPRFLKAMGDAIEEALR